MAGLVLELAGKEKEDDRSCGTDIDIEIISGVTAALSGAALLGAPLVHDFAVISLSDRLTPWEKIEKRLRAAAEADLCIVIYNPSSRGRKEHLHRAAQILMEHVPESRICGIADRIGRDGEKTRVMTLEELADAETDMFSTVFVGNSSTRRLGNRMVTPRGYSSEK
jgi:precorrin-3B C17-methyltransferase